MIGCIRVNNMQTRKILSWNVNGIRAIHKKGFLDWFAETSPDMLCIQETKAHREQLPEELTETTGYNVYFAEAEKKGYSGVALYTKEKPNRVNIGFEIAKFDSEGRTIIAEYDGFTLCNVYFPNGKMSPERLRYKLDFYDAFLEHIETRRAGGENIVICGDVNTAHKEIDLARPKANEKNSGFLPEERVWIDKLIGTGYIDTFRMFDERPENYTWWDYKTRARQRNVGWRIDYFFVSSEFAPKVKSAFILKDIMGSDHCPIGIGVEL